ncbi:hypothetical protein TNCV_3956441 [Trichonephila clavipes]|nr:hypothetical protein TNCV_3956441 [Trichonephila clavipes]
MTGHPTYCSHSYNNPDALDVTFASRDIFTSCSWTVFDSVGTDHSPVLIELSHTHTTPFKNMPYSGILKKPTGNRTNPPWIILCLLQCYSVILTANGSFQRFGIKSRLCGHYQRQ